jgi:hypothetical protein
MPVPKTKVEKPKKPAKPKPAKVTGPSGKPKDGRQLELLEFPAIN